MIADILAKNGLTEKEISIYLAVLELGEATVAQTAERAHLKRTTVYSTIEDMKRKGLLSHTMRRGIVYLSALPPRALIDRIAHASRMAESALPALLALASSASLQPTMRLLDGVQGIKDALMEFGSSKEATMGFTDYSVMPREIVTFIRTDIVPRRRSRNVPVRLIAQKNEVNAHVQKLDARNFGEHRLMELSSKSHPVEILLYGGRKTAFLSFGSGERFAIIIDSPSVHAMLRSIFEACWKSLSRECA